MTETIRLWLPIGLTVLIFGFNVWVYRSGARKQQLDKLEGDIKGVSTAASTRIAKLEEELAKHKDEGTASRADLRERLGQVEQTLTQMPDKDAVHNLAIAVTEIRGDIRAQGETMKAVAATARRVEEFLLAAGKSNPR